MSQGAILLIVIALIVAYAVARTRRRMGLAVSGRMWLYVVVAVMLGLVALWASQAG